MDKTLGIKWAIDPLTLKDMSFNVQHELRDKAYRKRTELGMAIINAMKDGEYYTIKIHPLKSYNDYMDFDHLKFEYTAEVYHTPTREHVIPKVIYKTVYKDDKPTNIKTAVEWQCGHCDTPHDFTYTVCSSCGAPRAKLIQEVFGINL